MANNKKIAIISSDRFVGKINEDIWLRDELLSQGEQCEIVSWEEENIVWTNYKSAVLRSSWWYHKRINDFLKFLQKLELSEVRLFNDKKIVEWNIQKDLQFKDLNLLGIKTVPTIFIPNNSINLKKEIAASYMEKYENLVIKPSISGSGDRTFLISRNESTSNHKNRLSLDEAESYFQKAANDDQVRCIMIQPFLEGISDGEYSFVFIDSELTHVAIRYPGIFEIKKDPVEINKLHIPDDMMSFAAQSQKALNHISDKIIKGYTPLYLRCDIVRSNSQLYLMEAEMAEPDLLIKTISSEQDRENIIKKFANSISRRSK